MSDETKDKTEPITDSKSRDWFDGFETGYVVGRRESNTLLVNMFYGAVLVISLYFMYMDRHA